jgi:hypothetical protein
LGSPATSRKIRSIEYSRILSLILKRRVSYTAPIYTKMPTIYNLRCDDRRGRDANLNAIEDMRPNGTLMPLAELKSELVRQERLYYAYFNFPQENVTNTRLRTNSGMPRRQPEERQDRLAALFRMSLDESGSQVYTCCGIKYSRDFGFEYTKKGGVQYT